MIAAALACWRLGKAALFLDYRLTPTDARSWLRRAGPVMIVASQARLRDAGAGVAIMPDPDTLPAHAFADHDAAPDDISEFVTSSGVTGEPKITPISHERLLGMVRASAEDGRRGPWGEALSPLSVAFGGSRHVWWRNLLAGKRIHAMEMLFSTAELDRALREPGVEECGLPPHLIRALLDHARRHPGPEPRYPHLLKLHCIGGPARAEDKLAAQQLLCADYLMTYSSTETGVLARISGTDLRRKPASCGKVSLPPGARLDIIGEDDARLPVGEAGRIRVSYPARSGGDPIHLYPGDHGWIDDEGFLFITGRGAGILCRNGVNFSVAALEAKLMASGLLRDVAVLPMRAAAGDDTLAIAVLPLHPGASEIGRNLRRHLVSHEQPEHLIRLHPTDLTPGGKIPRAALLERLIAAPQDLEHI